MFIVIVLRTIFGRDSENTSGRGCCLLFSALLPLLVSGCLNLNTNDGPAAGTSITLQKDPSFDKVMYRSIVVLAEEFRLEHQVYVEDRVCEELQSYGVQCYRGTNLVPLPRRIGRKRDDWFSELRQSAQFQAIMLIKLDESYMETMHIPRPPQLGGGMIMTIKPWMNNTVMLLDYSHGEEIAFVASGKSGGRHGASYYDLFDSLAKKLVSEMASHGLIDGIGESDRGQENPE